MTFFLLLDTVSFQKICLFFANQCKINALRCAAFKDNNCSWSYHANRVSPYHLQHHDSNNMFQGIEFQTRPSMIIDHIVGSLTMICPFRSQHIPISGKMRLSWRGHPQVTMVVSIRKTQVKDLDDVGLPQLYRKPPYGGFHKWGTPKMYGLRWKIPFKWMIWGYFHFRKPLYGDSIVQVNDIVPIGIHQSTLPHRLCDPAI